MQGLVLHLFYGIVAGGIFALVVPLFEFIEVDTLVLALLWGLLFGFVLFIGGAIFWMRIVLDIEPDRKMVGMFLLFHLMYGIVFGVWIGLKIL